MLPKVIGNSGKAVNDPVMLHCYSKGATRRSYSLKHEVYRAAAVVICRSVTLMSPLYHKGLIAKIGLLLEVENITLPAVDLNPLSSGFYL